MRYVFLLDPPFPHEVAIDEHDRAEALIALDEKHPGASGRVKRVIEERDEPRRFTVH